MIAAAEALEAALHGTPFAGRVEAHDELASTIDRCRELAEQGAPEGAVVMADRQSAGRGQPGHSWFSPPGTGVYLSVLLRPGLRAQDAGILARVAGLAGATALRGLGIPCRVKLPNDLVAPLDGRWRKVGGLLVDTAIQADRLRHAVVSLGVNVRLRREDLPDELRDVAASCHELARGSAPGREAVAATFLRELAGLAGELASPEGRARIDARHAAHVRAVAPGDPAGPGDARMED